MDKRDCGELNQLLAIIESANIGIVVFDRALTVAVFNRFMQVHSGIAAQRALGAALPALFPELPAVWLQRRVRSVFELGIPVYTSWEERPYLFHFPLRLPIHHDMDTMYQNIMLMPLRGADSSITQVGMVVYDVTDIALSRRQLEHTQSELLRQSRTDGLTELWSRGYWEERLQQEWQRGLRSGNPAALVMLDIDHFKHINDSHGHPAGDAVIRSVAHTLRSSARSIDICGRYGGEEFAVILPDTPADGAYIFCERLRRAIGRQQVSAGDACVTFTVSLGAAAFDPQLGSALHWLESADRALYAAKNGGRNQTRLAD